MKNARTAYYAVAFCLTMFGLTFASAPLYDLFCKTTGFGGAAVTQNVIEPKKHLSREINVTFEATVGAGLNITFAPEQRSIKIPLGKVVTVNYIIENKGDERITAIASYNVSPPQAGRYFQKLQCFCFTDQVIEPKQKIELPVVFFIDAELNDNNEFRKMEEIGLSYTFFPAKQQKTLETTSISRY